MIRQRMRPMTPLGRASSWSWLECLCSSIGYCSAVQYLDVLVLGISAHDFDFLSIMSYHCTFQCFMSSEIYHCKQIGYDMLSEILIAAQSQSTEYIEWMFKRSDIQLQLVFTHFSHFYQRVHRNSTIFAFQVGQILGCLLVVFEER